MSFNRRKLLKYSLYSLTMLHFRIAIAKSREKTQSKLISGTPNPHDAPMSIIRNAFPQRQVIGVNGNILAKGGGGVHCITQQVPLV